MIGKLHDIYTLTETEMEVRDLENYIWPPPPPPPRGGRLHI